ncbi:hypothetical protein OIO90_001342 [Microbotryomycetes sp. JL221]|nr:hypothetical protein OIO90_001342 [Microbotryomycetes sp. JL221]
MSYNNSPYPPSAQGGQGYNQYGAPPQQTQQWNSPQQYGGGAPPSGANPPYGAGYGQQQQPAYGQQQPNYGAGYQQSGPPGGQGGYYGGASAPPPNQPPNQQQLQQWFSAVDADRSGHITGTELRQALVNGDWSPFSDETINMLMSMFDQDRNGTIGFNEFVGMWNYVKEWQSCFRTFDRDRSGTIEGRELSNALSQFGYNLSPRLIDMLQKKYNPVPPKSMPGTTGPGPRGINFGTPTGNSDLELSEGQTTTTMAGSTLGMSSLWTWCCKLHDLSIVH